MKVACIAPIRNLDLISDMDYHMALAHLVLEENPTYLGFYRSQIERGAFVIMDNGAAEGITLRPEQLADAAELLNPSELVLPDCIGDRKRTLELLEESLNCRELMEHVRMHGTKLMAVPQGSSISQWASCAAAMLATEQVGTIGISKFAADLHPDVAVRGRTALVNILYLYNPQPFRAYDIHYLGLHCSPVELSLAPDCVRGVDTCLPIEAARHGVYFNEDFGLLYRPSKWQYEPKVAIRASLYPAARHNIATMLEMARIKRIQ